MKCVFRYLACLFLSSLALTSCGGNNSGGDEPAPKVTINNPSDVYYGATLVLDGVLKLRFYFEGNDREVELAGEIATVKNNVSIAM